MRTLLVFALLSVACGAPAPASLKVTPPPVPIVDATPHALNAKLLDAKGKPVDLPIAYAADPSGVVAVGADGALRCAKQGEGQATVTGGGKSVVVDVVCRVVAKVTAPPKLTAVIGADPPTLLASAQDATGRTLDDVPLLFEGYDARLIEVAGGRVIPSAVGRTTVTSRVGEATARTEVDVLRRVSKHALDLPTDGVHVVGLEQGKLVVDVKTKQPVSLKFTNAPCPDQKPAKTHRLECTLAGPGRLTIEGAGTIVTGVVEVTEVP